MRNFRLFHWLLFVTLVVPVQAFATGSEPPSCEEGLQATLDTGRLQEILNQGFRQHYSLTQRLHLARHIGFHLRHPFRVSEVFSFFPKGQLPPLATVNEVRILRISRTEGIRRLHGGVELGEERAWAYSPKLRLWIYDSAFKAGPQFVYGNNLLKDIFIRELGPLEHFHTHPDIGVRELDRSSPWLRNYGLSRNRRALIAALPSSQDIRLLMGWIKRGHHPSALTAHIIHRFGVTSFGVIPYYYETETGDLGKVFPVIPPFEPLYQLMQEPGSSEEVIRAMLGMTEDLSSDLVELPPGVPAWPAGKAPRILIFYTPAPKKTPSPSSRERL